MSEISLPRRREITAALRNGTVPRRGLELFAVGLERFEAAIDQELAHVAQGNGAFKAIRGEYGTGKTFFARWVQHRAQRLGFATAEVQISETETPLHKMETVYRRATESLRTKEWEEGAFRSLIERWFYSLEEEVMARPGLDVTDPQVVTRAVGELLEARLKQVSATQPLFAQALRASHAARASGDEATADGLLSWLMGQPNVGAASKRSAGIKGDLDHFGAGGFFRGLLTILAQTQRKGLVLVLDEVETIQRVRGDIREKSLNALRQLIDDLDGGRFPGMYVVITGTPAFYEGPQGIKRLPPLAQRLHVDFDDSGFESAKAIQIRLPAFDATRLLAVGRKVREIYPAADAARVAARAPDAVLEALGKKIAGRLGGAVGVAPRLFLKKLVAILDKVDEFPEYDPARHGDLGALTVDEMNEQERVAAGIERTPDDIALDLKDEGS